MTSQTSPTSSIEFSGVTKSYGSVRALSNVDFVIRGGEVVAMLGPNGAGKSTVVDLMLGLRTPDAGSVRVLGGDPVSAVDRGDVSALLQSGSLPVGAKVGEIVALCRRLYGNTRTQAEILGLAGLDGIENRRADGLSGGQVQRVRFAMAIAGRPRVLFLDEPTVALDIEARQHFWQSIRSIAGEGTTIVFATHYLEEADDNADRIIMLKRGQVVADGPPSEIRSATSIRTVRFALDGRVRAELEAITGVVEAISHGDTVTLRCSDADAAVAELYARYRNLRDISVSSTGLEEALLSLTSDTSTTDTPAHPERAAVSSPS